MLVFTRKAGESLIIGDNIKVSILSIDRDQIRIGIEAPREIPIHRREVYELICEQNKLASDFTLPPSSLRSKYLDKD